MSKRSEKGGLAWLWPVVIIVILIPLIIFLATRNGKVDFNVASVNTAATTLNSITLNIDADGEELTYYYSLDNGKTYKKVDGPNFTINGLEENKSYTILVKAVDKNGNEKITQVKAKTAGDSSRVKLELAESTLSLKKGGEKVSVAITGENYGTLSCKTSEKKIVTCEIKDNLLIVAPGNTTGEAVITVSEAKYNKVATLNATVSDEITVPNTNAGTTPGSNEPVVPTPTEPEVTLGLSATTGENYIGGFQNTITVTGENYGALTISSSNTDIATAILVGKDLTIKTGNTAGEAVITVTESKKHKVAFYTIIVKPVELYIDKAGLQTAYVNGSPITATLSGANHGELSCESDNESAATCDIDDNTLTVTPIATGNAHITVREDRLDKTVGLDVEIKSITVSIRSNDVLFGTVSTGVLTNVAPNTAIITNDNTLTIGDANVIATPTTSTAQYAYTLTGWTHDCGAQITDNCTITATFSQSLRSYTVTWKNWDGSVLKSETLDYGTTPAYTDGTPTKDAEENHRQDFTGWEPAIDAVTTDQAYTAQFIDRYFDAYFNGDTVYVSSENLQDATNLAGEISALNAGSFDCVSSNEQILHCDVQTQTETGAAVYITPIATVEAETTIKVTAFGTIYGSKEFQITIKPVSLTVSEDNFNVLLGDMDNIVEFEIEGTNYGEVSLGGYDEKIIGVNRTDNIVTGTIIGIGSTTITLREGRLGIEKTVSVNISTKTLADIQSMQEINPTICALSNIYDESDPATTYLLADTRIVNRNPDGTGGTESTQFYNVRKLSDGNCWMAENLRVADATYYSDDTAIEAGEGGTLGSYTLTDTVTSVVDVPGNTYDGEEYGYWYLFKKAEPDAASWAGNNYTGLQSEYSICPAGWHIPTADESRILVGSTMSATDATLKALGYSAESLYDTGLQEGEFSTPGARTGYFGHIEPSGNKPNSNKLSIRFSTDGSISLLPFMSSTGGNYSTLNMVKNSVGSSNDKPFGRFSVSGESGSGNLEKKMHARCVANNNIPHLYLEGSDTEITKSADVEQVHEYVISTTGGSAFGSIDCISSNPNIAICSTARGENNNWILTVTGLESQSVDIQIRAITNTDPNDTATHNVIDGVNQPILHLNLTPSSSVATNYVYELSDGYVILRDYIGSESEIIIADSYTVDGNVYNTMIGEHNDSHSGPFYNKQGITSISISGTVPVENGNASYLFYGMDNLEMVNRIPYNVTNLDYAFYGCNSIKKFVEIPKNVTTINHIYDGISNYTNLSKSNFFIIRSEHITSAEDMLNGNLSSPNRDVYIYTKSGSDTWNTLSGLTLSSRVQIGDIYYYPDEYISLQKIYASVGHTSYVFTNSILPLKPEFFEVSYEADYGTSTNEKWEYTPQASDGCVGSSFQLTVNIHDKYTHEFIKGKTITVYVSDTSVLSDRTRTAFINGASFQSGGTQSNRFLEYATNDNFNLSLIGTKGTAPYLHEAIGGWSPKTWVTSTSSPFRNPDTGVYDFNYYMSSNGFTDVDYYIIGAVGNGFFDDSNLTFESADTKMRNVVTPYADIQIEQIKAYNPDVKIIIATLNYSNASYEKFAGDYSTWDKDNFDRANAMKNAAFQNYYGGREDENIYLYPMQYLDRTADYVNGIHMYNSGYTKMAEYWYSWITYNESKSDLQN